MIDYTLPLDQLPDPLPIVPLEKPFDVTITPPGSKSITNRAYVLAALAEGTSRIVRPLRALDTDLLLDALCTLGVEAKWEGDDVLITGVDGRFPRGGTVNLGDGGTPTRFMIAAACLAAEPVTIDGSPRMRERPIAEGVDMLRQLGARIGYVEEEGRLPVRVMPGGIQGGTLEVGSTQSSQSISAIMLIGSYIGVQIEHEGELTSAAYVQLTIDVLTEWKLRKGLGGSARNRSLEEGLPNPLIIPLDAIKANDFWIDRDASSSVYWCAAGLFREKSNCHLNGIGSAIRQPDLLAVREFAIRGEGPDFSKDEVLFQGPHSFRGFTCGAANMPDGAMMVSVAAARATTPSRLTGLKTLRVKETDRIAALANELRKVGCRVEAGDDWISIDPASHRLEACAPGEAPPVTIETYNDHRMAMAFAILGLVRPGISIRNPACVAKSYPVFWKDFATLYQ